MIETDRLIATAAESPQEEALERALRPKALEEYIGQEKARGQLETGVIVPDPPFRVKYLERVHRVNPFDGRATSLA